MFQCPLLCKAGMCRLVHACERSYLLFKLLSALSMAFLTIFPQSLEETLPHPPSFITVSYTPSSFAISYLSLSDIMPFRLPSTYSPFLTGSPEKQRDACPVFK